MDALMKEGEGEELFMIPCCHCGFRFERDTRMHDYAICDDDDNWFCQDCHELCHKEESEEELCWCKVGIKECDCDKCGRCGCYECVSGGHGGNEDESWCEECEVEQR